MFEFYLLIVLFPLYFSETIIPVSNFQNVTIPFETEYCDYILKYSITGYTSFQYTKLVIRKFEIINFYLMDYHYMYLYDNLDTLLEDKKNKAFSNNIYKKRFNGYDQIFEIDVFNNHEDKTYYLAFEKNHYQFYKYNGTFLIYSTIANLTITQPISFTGKTANYLFYISSQHEKKYSHFGFRRMINDVLGKIEIFDGQSYKLLYQNDSKDYIEDYFELQMKYCYYISLTLTSNSQNNGNINKIYFYLLQTDYNDLIINLQQSSDFKEFPVSTKTIMGKKIIFSGGGYFRLVPYYFLKSWSAECVSGYKNHMVSRIWHDKDGNVMMGEDGLPVTRDVGYLLSYIHPRDLDGGQPMLEGLPLNRKIKSYVGTKGAAEKLLRYLKDFKFTDVRTAAENICWEKMPVVRL